MHLPKDFEIRMQKQLGNDFENFIKSLEEAPPVTIRLNPNKTGSVLKANKSVLWEPMAYYLDKRPIFTLDPQFHGGAYYVQEASSMFIGYLFKQLFDKDQSLKILDLCGAPGGKSTHIASLMNSNSFLVANEVIKTRTTILTENLIKHGNPNVIVTQNDPTDFQRLPSFFDLVIVDAPCSGEGLFRRDEAAMNEWSVDNAQLCALRQQRILTDAWETLAPGGFLIYSTCTYNPVENEKNLAWLAEQKGAKSISIEVPKEWNIHQILYQNMEGFQFFPNKIQGEGFFASILQKEDSESTFRNKTRNKFDVPKKDFTLELNSWLLNSSIFKFIEINQAIRALPESIQPWIELISEKLRVVHSGILMAEIKGNRLIPQHDLSLSWFLNTQSFPSIDLDEYDALVYLKKENIHVANGKKGFNIVTSRNLPIGFLNYLENRSNNNYPSNWRIRMNLPAKEAFISQQVLKFHEV